MYNKDYQLTISRKAKINLNYERKTKFRFEKHKVILNFKKINPPAMKTNIQNLAMLSAVIAFGCHSDRTGEKVNNASKTETALSEKKTITTPEIINIEGIVKTIFHGKDGYIANIHTNNNLIYFATISRSNLKDPQQYRQFKVNETVKLNGDHWKIDDEDQLTVREIQQ